MQMFSPLASRAKLLNAVPLPIVRTGMTRYPVVGKVLHVVRDDDVGATLDRGRDNMPVVEIGQVKGCLEGFPPFDERVREGGG